MQNLVLENSIIESILNQYKNVLKSDFPIYRNHVYRIFNFALIKDSKEENMTKYAIAAAFHDIGIWTDSFDYLEPSIALATEYLKKNEKENLVKEISLMIDNHHKRSIYKGDFKETAETFRRADWVDVVMRMSSFGFAKEDYKRVQKQFSNKGFHWFLMKQSFKYFLKHPFNPLPMFKK